MVDWKRKLTSRKFWVAVVGFVTALLVGFGFAESDITQIVTIIMAGATLIAYIIGEGMIDAKSVNAQEEIIVIGNEEDETDGS